MTHNMNDLPRQDPIELMYTNWRGETALRRIVPISLGFGSTDWHPEPQWLLTAWDADRAAYREFALKDFGDPGPLRASPRAIGIAAKIAARVAITPGPLATPCHVWQGPSSGDKGRGKNYPRMNLDGQTVAVHRVAYTNVHGLIPGRKQIDHLCRNRMCVNAEHLEMTTHKQNQKRRDKAAKGE